jgi:hypothetical protein
MPDPSPLQELNDLCEKLSADQRDELLQCLLVAASRGGEAKVKALEDELSCQTVFVSARSLSSLGSAWPQASPTKPWREEPMANLNCTRIYADESGQSHAAEQLIELDITAFETAVPAFEVSTPIAVSLARFSVMPPGWVGDWHPAPRRQYSLHLAGELEVEVGDGRVCRFGPGSIVLLEDVSGQGHRTRVVGEQPVVGVFMQLP